MPGWRPIALTVLLALLLAGCAPPARPSAEGKAGQAPPAAGSSLAKVEPGGFNRI